MGADPGGVEMVLQSQKHPQAQPNVVALRAFRTSLGAFHTAVLLEFPMVVLNSERQFRQLPPFQAVHLQVAGRPVFNVAVWSDHLEHADQTITFEVDHRAGRRDLALRERSQPAAVGVDLSIGFESAQPQPLVIADPFEVFEAGVPTVEQDVLGLEPTPLAIDNISQKWSFLVSFSCAANVLSVSRMR